MNAIFSIFPRRATVVCLAAVVLGVVAARAVAAGAGGPAPDDVAYQKAIAELKSGDADRVAQVEASVKAGIADWNPNAVSLRVLGFMANDKSMAADADAICLEAILHNPESRIGDAFLAERITALLQEGKKDEALAAAKSFYDAASLAGTADAIRMVTRCLILDTPPEKKLASRFKRQQIAWATAGGATTQPGAQGGPATQAAGNPAASPRRGAGGGEEGGLGEPVLATIKGDATPYEAAIKANNPVGSETFIQKGDLLLLADRPGEAKAAFEQAEELAENDEQHRDAAEGIARAIRAESGCIGPANSYILSLRGQK